MSPVLFPRQQTIPNNGNGEIFIEDDRNDWWFSPTAVIVKWSILGAIVLFFFLWFVGGSIHARRRIKKGLHPLRYHRFLAPSSYQPPRGPQLYADFYRMENTGYNVPPPMPRDPNAQMPQAYPADHKIDPDQAYDAPPPGNPPSELPPRQPPKANGIINRINPFHK